MPEEKKEKGDDTSWESGAGTDEILGSFEMIEKGKSKSKSEFENKKTSKTKLKNLKQEVER